MISFTEPITARPHNRFNEDHTKSTTTIGSKARQGNYIYLFGLINLKNLSNYNIFFTECLKFSNQGQMSLSYHILGGENAENGEFPHMVCM